MFLMSLKGGEEGYRVSVDSVLQETTARAEQRYTTTVFSLCYVRYPNLYIVLSEVLETHDS